MKKIFKITMALFFVCLIAVGALATVEYITRDQIKANGKKEIEAALGILMPNCDYSEITADVDAERTLFNSENQNSQITQVFCAKLDGNEQGYIVVLNTKGYVDKISLRVGIYSDGTIAGVIVGENSETPGLGANISKDWFLEQYKGGITPFNNDDIDKITSATYSSNYVTQGINSAGEFVRMLKGGQK